MDSEVTILLQCDPLQALEENQTRVEVSHRFNRQSFLENEEDIEAVWRNRMTKEPWLFNGAKFRLHSATLSLSSTSDSACRWSEKVKPTCFQKQMHVLNLRLGLTCYKDYLGTNWSTAVGNLQSRGQAEWSDPQAFLAQPLGVGAIMVTLSGEVVLLRRSQKVAEAAGLIDIPGGHPEPKVVCPQVSEEKIHVDHLQGKERAIVCEIFSSVCAEISAEVNVPPSSLSDPLFMGIALNHTSAGRPSAEFYVRCSLTTEEVRDFYRRGGPEAHESTDILFLSRDEVLQLDERCFLWSEMCPSAKGAVLLYQRVMPLS